MALDRCGEFASVWRYVLRAPPRESAIAASSVFAKGRARSSASEAAPQKASPAAFAQVIRRAGASPVLLRYPVGAVGAAKEVLPRVALAVGGPCVPVFERFQREFETRERSELLAPDTHCNDAGYEIMGEMAADVVAAELVR